MDHTPSYAYPSPHPDHGESHLLDQMDEMVRLVTPDGRVSFENKVMEDFFSRIDEDSRDVFPLETANEVFRTGEKTVTELCYRHRVYSLKSVPIWSQDKITGVLQNFRDITIQNQITMDVFSTNRHIREDMRLAHLIQANLLPKMDSFFSLRFDSRYRSSNELSGDFFDLIPLAPGKIGLYITDVVGHGISASLLTIFIRQTMRSILEEEEVGPPARVLFRLTERFADLDFDDSQYFTMFYCVFDLIEGTYTYANAGHNCIPLTWRDGQLDRLEARGRMISPLFRNYRYREKKGKLLPNQSFLFYTDGVEERVNAQGEIFGSHRLARLMEKMEKEKGSLDLDQVLDVLDRFGPGPQQDDIALLYVENRPGSPGPGRKKK